MTNLRALTLVSSFVSICVCALASAQPATPPTQGAPRTPAQGTPAAPQPASPQDQARRSKLVAKVGDIRITVGDVEDTINAQSPFLRARFSDPEKLKEYVQNLVRFELLARAAQSKGYANNPAVVRSVKQSAVQQLVRTDFDERITPESVSNEAVRAYYDQHSAEFNRPEMVRASHILVATEQEADQLIEQLKTADARRFREVARERSIDTETKLRGGDLRYFSNEGRPPESQDSPVDAAIVEAAFRLREVGDLARRPVKVGEHYSLVMLTGRRPAEHRAFEDAAQGIRLRLWRESRQEAIERLVADLKTRYRPEIHEDRMARIWLNPAPEGGGLVGGPHGNELGRPHPSKTKLEAAKKRPAP